MEEVTKEIENGFISYSNGEANVPPVGHLPFPAGDCHIKSGHIKFGDSKISHASLLNCSFEAFSKISHASLLNCSFEAFITWSFDRSGHSIENT
ncbi:MAG: hypothetical protein JRE58_15320 [Deltaproteobacteria bacterium]|nr:hypothetical protein [Deltaproteobacteria bacterium]